MEILQRLRAIGWAAVEAAFLLIVLCLLLDIIIGAQPNSFVSAVARNATNFLQSLPSGIVVGGAAVAVVYAFLRTRLPR